MKARNVRAAPTTDAPIVGEFSGGEQVKVLSDEQGDDVDGNATWYRIDGGRFAGAHVHSSLIERQPDPEPSIVPPDREVGHDPWIVVDRVASTLTLLLPMDARPCGSCNVLLPATLVAGTYEFRLFSANSYQLPATSLGVPSRQLDATTVGSACRRGTGLRATRRGRTGHRPGL